MSVQRHSFTHYSLLRIRVDYAPTFSPPITLLHLSKEPIPRLTFASSSSSYFLPIVAEQDLKEEDRIFDEKEKKRRIKKELSKKERVAWNKGIKLTAESRELIKIRTLEALSDPKVRKERYAKRTKTHHSDQIKAKISYSQTLQWQERLKLKRATALIFLFWRRNIANAAMKGVSGQEELDWDSYYKIKLHQHLEKRKIEHQKKIIWSWIQNIAKTAKEGGSGEQELDWDSYIKIRKEMFPFIQLQRSAEKAKAKEIEKIEKAKAKEREKLNAKKESQMKAIRRIRRTQKNRDIRRRARSRKNKKNQPYKNTEQDKHALEVTPSKLTKDHVSNNISSEVAEKGDIMYSNFPTHGKLDLELIKEKMHKKVSLAEQIQAAKLMKAKLNS